MIKEILKVKIDFKELEKWRDPERDNVPAASFIAVYRALGIEDAIAKYAKRHKGFQVAPLDNIVCNLETHKRLKHFIEENWQVYSIDIDKDCHVFWDTSKYPKGTRHYPKTLKATARNAVLLDFQSFAPGLDNNLEDNEIVFGIQVADPEVEIKEGK